LDAARIASRAITRNVETEQMEGRMTDLREEMRRGFDRIDDRFAQIDARFGHFDARLLSLEQKVDRQFVWLVGIQLTTMLTVVGVLTAAVFRTP
jgi:hypothetical protein